MEKKAGFKARADEAMTIIGGLLNGGMTTAQIAAATFVSERTVIRWGREGSAPHPIMLDNLRKLAAKKGITNAHREGQ